MIGSEIPRTGAQESSLDSRVESPRRYLLPAMFAFLLRISWMLIAGTYVLYRGDLGDIWLYGFEMGSVGRSIAHGLGFSSPFAPFVGQTGPTAWVAPVYPLIIACVTKLFGDFSTTSVVILMSLNCAFSALTCIPLYLAGEATFGRRTAWFAAWAWALIPYFNLWHTWLWDVNLSALLLMIMFWLTVRAAESRSWRYELGLGTVAGLIAVTNPSLLSFLPVSLIWIFWRRRHSRSGWLRPALLVGVTILVIVAPWAIRNRFAFHRWVFLRSNFGAEFYLRNKHAMTQEEWLRGHPAINWYEGNAYRQLGEIAYNHDRMEQALRTVREYPGEFAKVSLLRMVEFWTGSLPTGYGEDAFWRHLYLPLSVLGLAGVVLAIARGTPARWLYFGVVAVYPLVFYFTQPLTRYRFPMEPVLLLLASFAICECWSWATAQKSLAITGSPSLARTGWITVCLLLLVSGGLGIERASGRHVQAFPAPVTLAPQHFMEVCGHPDAQSTEGDVVELDYRKAGVRVRIVDDRFGWVFDRTSGNLIMSAQSLGCWKHAAGE